MGAVRRAMAIATVALASLGLAGPVGASGHPAHITYAARMAHIDAVFAHAVAVANHRYHVAEARAHSASGRIIARNRLRAAVAEAIREREHEVEVLDSSPLGTDGPDHAAIHRVSGGDH